MINMLIMIAFTIIAIAIIYNVSYQAFYPIIRAYRIKHSKRK